MENENTRYIVIEDSVSKHCCFEYSIIDTAAGKEDYGDYKPWKRSMCETFNKTDAEIICESLNQKDNIINDIDHRLSVIEDYAKGEAGVEITKLRKYISENYGK